MLIAYDKDMIINQPQDIVSMLQKWLKSLDKIDIDKEHFIGIHLNTRSKVKNIEVISVGIINSTIVHPREVFRRAIINSATQMIIAHNHPSGDCSPSDEDVVMTKRIKEVGEVVGIHILDHVIFSNTSFYSLALNGDI